MRDEWAVSRGRAVAADKEGLHMSEAERAAFARWMTELRPNFA